MSNHDLGSELARASIGIVPASNIPEIVLKQFYLISWDRQRAPGLFWRLPSLTWQDLDEGKISSIDGFKIANNEIVAVLKEGEIVALVPEGSWVMKPEAELEAEKLEGSQFELIWIDLRPIKLNFDIKDIPIQGKNHLQGELSFCVADPAKMINEIILKNNKSFDLENEILGRLTILMKDESSLINYHDPSWQSLITESSRKKLGELLSSWGLLLTGFKILEQESQFTKSVKVLEDKRRSVQNQNGSYAKSSTIQTPNLDPTGTKIQKPKDEVIQMLEWDTAPKRWVPASRRGEIKCDGCGERANLFAMCALSCKFLHKCILCRKCYLIRKSCTFFITLEDIQPRKRSTDELHEMAKIDAKRKLKD